MEFIIFTPPVFELDMLILNGGCNTVTCDKFGSQCKAHCGTITCGQMSADNITWD